MLMKKTALSIGILLIVCIFLVILPHYANAQKLAIATQTLEYNKAFGISRAYEFFATQGMRAETFQGKASLIFGEKPNMHCAISLYPMGKQTVAFIAVAHNNRNEARRMRDMIRTHMMRPRPRLGGPIGSM